MIWMGLVVVFVVVLLGLGFCGEQRIFREVQEIERESGRTIAP